MVSKEFQIWLIIQLWKYAKMKRSIYFVFGILHFVRQNPGDFAKIEMQNFGKNISNFKKFACLIFRNLIFSSLYGAIKYYRQSWPEHRRHRKWTFQNETKNPWKSELITLKNKKVRALSFWILKNQTFFLTILRIW